MKDVLTPAYALEAQIGFKLRVASQRHLEVFSALMPDLTPMQFSALVKLGEHRVLSQNHLGRLVAMDAATTKGVVDRLRAKGLIDRVHSTTDRRRLDLSLTATGAGFLRTALPQAQAISAETTKALSPAELELLLSLLDRL